MKSLFLFLLLFAGVVAVSDAADSNLEFSPVFDLRVRQEYLDGVYHFAPDPDRDWVRVRTRAGFGLAGESHRLDLLLTNEHRHFIQPDDRDFDWDELVIDQLRWTWSHADKSKLTVGRQNIIWNKGFLMLEGHPLDGSRSIYHNAVRWQSGQLDLALIHNPKRDKLVLANDQDKALTDADETALAARLTGDIWQFAVIMKNEVDPDDVLADLFTVTFAPRGEFRFCNGSSLTAELALQYQSFGAAPTDSSVVIADLDQWAAAGQVFYRHGFSEAVKYEVGGFFYSGAPGEAGFRTPWGRWPKWSELYIYSLIGESTPGRVHVAAWENIAAPRAQLTFPVAKTIQGRLGLTYLLAPKPDWQARGLLTQAELKFDLPLALKGHLLWEMLDPGAFHHGDNGLAPLTDTVHFLRWQLAYAFK